MANLAELHTLNIELVKAQYHVARAKTIDEQEKELRKRQQQERERYS